MTSKFGKLFAATALGAVVALMSVEGRTADLAQPSPTAEPSSLAPEWHFYSAAYLWMTSVNGDARVLPPLPTAKVDVSFVDALKDIEGGLIATGFARYDRFLILADVLASRSTPSQTVTALGVSGTLSSVGKSLTTLGAVGYRVIDGPNLILDAYAGARWWFMENTISLSAPGILNIELNKSKSWVDGVVGGQIRYNFDSKFYVNTIGFVGAGGAKVEGDVYAGVGYRFNDRYEAYAGYRALYVNYESGPFLYKITQHGPIIGFGTKF